MDLLSPIFVADKIIYSQAKAIFFFLYWPDRFNFWQIKIIIKMISHWNISFFFYCFYKITIKYMHKKQKFSALDIVESLNKEMWSVIITQVSLTWRSIFLVLNVPTIKLRIIVNILLTNQSIIIFLTTHTKKYQVDSTL